MPIAAFTATATRAVQDDVVQAARPAESLRRAGQLRPSRAVLPGRRRRTGTRTRRCWTSSDGTRASPASSTAAPARRWSAPPGSWPGSGVSAVAYHAGMEDERAAGTAGGLRQGRGAGGGGHHRLRHGHRQAERALGRARRPAAQRRGLLPGDGPRRARRRERGHAAAPRPVGHRGRAVAHREDRIARGAPARRGPAGGDTRLRGISGLPADAAARALRRAPSRGAAAAATSARERWRRRTSPRRPAASSPPPRERASDSAPTTSRTSWSAPPRTRCWSGVTRTFPRSASAGTATVTGGCR